MLTNNTKAKLKAGEIVFGSEVMFPSPDVVEILGHAGLDYVYLDTEHSASTTESLVNMIRAAEVSGATPLVRVAASASSDYAGTLLRLFDLGAMGVIVPQIETKDQAQAVVEAVKFHPLGKRGMFDVGRGSGFGFKMSGPDYIRRSNEETMTVIMIESVAGIDNLPGILSVKEVDCILIGSADLAQSLGYPGKMTEPAVLEAIDAIMAQTHKAGMPVGVGSFASFPPEKIDHYLKNGATFINIVTNNLLTAGIRHWRGWLDKARSGG